MPADITIGIGLRSPAGFLPKLFPVVELDRRCPATVRDNRWKWPPCSSVATYDNQTKESRSCCSRSSWNHNVNAWLSASFGNVCREPFTSARSIHSFLSRYIARSPSCWIDFCRPRPLASLIHPLLLPYKWCRRGGTVEFESRVCLKCTFHRPIIPCVYSNRFP